MGPPDKATTMQTCRSAPKADRVTPRYSGGGGAEGLHRGGFIRFGAIRVIRVKNGGIRKMHAAYGELQRWRGRNIENKLSRLTIATLPSFPKL